MIKRGLSDIKKIKDLFIEEVRMLWEKIRVAREAQVLERKRQMRRYYEGSIDNF